MNTGPDLAGRLRVRPGAPLAQALHSSRRDWAGRLGQGQPVTALPGLLASLFNLCSHAHRLCAQLAIAAARPGAMAMPGDAAQRLRQETAQEHVRRIGLDWPRLLGPADGHAQGAALQALQTCPLLRPAANGDEPWPQALDWLQRECLHMPATTWLRAWQACGADWLLDWSTRHGGWLPALVRGAREADSGRALDMARALRVHGQDDHLRTLAAALALKPGFALQPLWHGACAHTGPWARLHSADDGLPLTPWALLGSRLAELVRLCLPDGPGQGAGWLRHGALHTADGQGLAWVEMARGLLVHQVELEPDVPVVRACRVLAPTEWNFHPAGEVARRISALDATLPAGLRTGQLNLLMAAFDPCVPFEVDAAPAVEGRWPMHEASLAGGVLQLVEDTARREGFARLLELRLEAGQLAGVDVRALRFALESLAPGTLLEGARIQIDEPPGQAWCMACAQTVAIAQRGDACPACGGHQLQPTGGMELRVVDMRVSDD